MTRPSGPLTPMLTHLLVAKDSNQRTCLRRTLPCIHHALDALQRHDVVMTMLDLYLITLFLPPLLSCIFVEAAQYHLLLVSVFVFACAPR